MMPRVAFPAGLTAFVAPGNASTVSNSTWVIPGTDSDRTTASAYRAGGDAAGDTRYEAGI
jgi:hypothetical protein